MQKAKQGESRPEAEPGSNVENDAVPELTKGQPAPSGNSTPPTPASLLPQTPTFSPLPSPLSPNSGSTPYSLGLPTPAHPSHILQTELPSLSDMFSNLQPSDGAPQPESQPHGPAPSFPAPPFLAPSFPAPLIHSTLAMTQHEQHPSYPWYPPEIFGQPYMQPPPPSASPAYLTQIQLEQQNLQLAQQNLQLEQQHLQLMQLNGQQLHEPSVDFYAQVSRWPDVIILHFMRKLEVPWPANVPADRIRCPHCWQDFVGFEHLYPQQEQGTVHPTEAQGVTPASTSARSCASAKHAINLQAWNHRPVKTPCGHILGRSCLIESLEKVNSLCPCCRQEFTCPGRKEEVYYIGSDKVRGSVLTAFKVE